MLRLERPVRLPLNPGGALRKAAHGGDAEQAAQGWWRWSPPGTPCRRPGNSVLIQQPRFARHGEARAQCAEEIVDQQHDDERNKTQFEGAENIHLNATLPMDASAPRVKIFSGNTVTPMGIPMIVVRTIEISSAPLIL